MLLAQLFQEPCWIRTAYRPGRCIEASTSNSTCSSRDEYIRQSFYHQIVRTLPASIKRAQVEDINTLHLSKNFETLKTSSLLEIGGHGTGLSTLGEKVGLGSDLCSAKELSAKPYHANCRAHRPAPCDIRHCHPPRPMARRRLFQRFSGGVLLTVERLDVLGNLTGLGVSVGTAVDW